MESNFNRDFEEYLKRNADQYRMIPSDKVWKGINRSLHGRRKWYGLGLALLLLLTSGSVTWVMISNSNPDALNNNIAENKVKPFDVIQPINPKKKETIDSRPQDMSALLSFGKKIQQEQKNSPVEPNDVNVTPGTIQAPAFTINFSPAAKSTNSTQQTTNNISRIVHEKQDDPIVNRIDHLAFLQQPLAAQSTIKDEVASVSKQIAQPVDPMTIESVVNSFKPKKLDRSIRWQIYFTPTVSYRKLRENKSFMSPDPFGSSTNYPFAALSDINSAVVHKPDFGFQLGASAGYPLTKNLTVTGGLQFNINRYDIKAFVYNGEQATINLSGGSGAANSVTTWTYYRNYNGYKTDWLNNFYFSVSVPIGIELKLLGKKKTYLGVAGTIQPTYILSDRAYLISTDYKNYAEVPWLIRHVNVNTSFETFVSYTNKRNTRWQIGPQVRYQVLSSFQSKYPVKENLFDFGVKLGVTLND
jgi:hypothetical protein